MTHLRVKLFLKREGFDGKKSDPSRSIWSNGQITLNARSTQWSFSLPAVIASCLAHFKIFANRFPGIVKDRALR